MLTELQVKNSKPEEKSYMLRDERGLYLRVDPTGRKYWILRYWENKKEHRLSLGAYPDLSLKGARLKRDEIQIARSKGESPSSKSHELQKNFSNIAAEWFNVRMKDKAQNYLDTVKIRLNKYILPAFGDSDIEKIKSRNVLELCRQIESLGHYETAHRVKTLIGQIFRYAIATGLAEYDPTVALAGALSPRQKVHYPTIIEPSEIKLLMRALKAYPYLIMRSALLFSIYTAARPGEIRQAEWSEIKDHVWDIPASKMKMKRRHLIPLSNQVKNVLAELKPFTGESRWLFPSPKNNSSCMSENGVCVALRSIKFFYLFYIKIYDII